MPSGYGWSFPAGDELRIGIGSYDPRFHVKEPTCASPTDEGADTVRYQGNWIPHRFREPVEDGVFFCGDSAGHCLAMSAEGIRTAWYFGIAVGRELAQVLAGARTREQALARYAAFARGAPLEVRVDVAQPALRAPPPRPAARLARPLHVAAAAHPLAVPQVPERRAPVVRAAGATPGPAARSGSPHEQVPHRTVSPAGRSSHALRAPAAPRFEDEPHEPALEALDGDVRLSEAHLAGAELAGRRLTGLRLADVVVERGNLANLVAPEPAFNRVALAGVRLTGVQWTRGRITDAVFRDCRIDLASSPGRRSSAWRSRTARSPRRTSARRCCGPCASTAAT